MGSVTPIATNFVVEDDVEGTVYSTSYFVNGDFDKVAHNGRGFHDESTWTSGLSYWSYEGNVSTTKIGVKNAQFVDTKENFIQDDYAGYMQGNSKLYQGLYELYGEYTVSGKYKSSGGTSTFFVRDALTKEVVYSEKMNIGMSWSNQEYTFVTNKNATLQIGFEHEGGGSFLLVDDVAITNKFNPDIYNVVGQEKTLSRANDFILYSSETPNVKYINQSIITSANSEIKMMACCLATWAGGTTYNGTGIITDCGINSSTNFINGDFDKDIYFESDKDFKSGLANWTREGSVGCEEVDSSLGYSAYIKGDGYLNEGLYVIFGTYNFSVLTKLISGNATLKVTDAITKEVLAEKPIIESDSFIKSSVDFKIDKPTTVRVGVYHQGSLSTKIYIDNADLASFRTDEDFELQNAKTKKLTRSSDFDIYSSNESNTKILNGEVYTSNNAETKIMARNITGYEFIIDMDISVSASNAQNCGVYLFAKNASSEADMIDALNVQIESKNNSDKYNVSLFKFSDSEGYVGCLAKSEELTYSGDILHLKIIVKNGVLLAFTDNSENFALMYTLPQEMRGGVGIRSQYQNTAISNIVVQYKDYSELSALTSLIRYFDSLDADKYTSESFQALADLIAVARTYDKYTVQDDINDMIQNINEAIQLLELKKDEPVVDPTKPADDKKGCSGSIVASSILMCCLSFAGVMVMKAKRKDD